MYTDKCIISKLNQNNSFGWQISHAIVAFLLDLGILQHCILTLLFCIGCSVREMCGKEDVDTTYRHFKAFFEMFSDIDRKLNVDF
jgi:hypothetical protein